MSRRSPPSSKRDIRESPRADNIRDSASDRSGAMLTAARARTILRSFAFVLLVLRNLK
jgi:hypothetical protein